MLFQQVLDASGDPSEADRQVMVSGVDEDCDEDMMQLIFSNQKRSGGGPIDRVEFEKDKDMMLITYEKQEGGNQSLLTDIVK